MPGGGGKTGRAKARWARARASERTDLRRSIIQQPDYCGGNARDVLQRRFPSMKPAP